MSRSLVELLPTFERNSAETTLLALIEQGLTLWGHAFDQNFGHQRELPDGIGLVES